MSLTSNQKARILELVNEYRSAPANEEGVTPGNGNAELNRSREHLIGTELQPLIAEYLDSSIPLAEFKSRIDSINKRHNFWGFKGIKGQMFFDMVANVSDDADECDQEIKSAIAVPANDKMASSRIKTFASYIERLGEQWVEAGNTRHGAPKVGSISFFLSWFWQIQAADTWPVFYTAGVNALNDLNIWQPTGEPADDYLAFKQLHYEIRELLATELGRAATLYDVEHVLWFKVGNPYQASKGTETKGKAWTAKAKQETPTDIPDEYLPNSYVPPIVSILPRMAIHDEALVEAAKRSGTSLPRAFEKHIDAAFSILGYETKLLGQGAGRVPDGLALAHDESYAILWDAKVRANGYSMGTDDRTIRDYIQTQSRELKRRRFLRNIYYVVVSSSFADDFDDAIRSLKMETDISEVALLEAEALVAMVDAKLRSPLFVSLGPDGLQRLFSTSGILDAGVVREQLN